MGWKSFLCKKDKNMETIKKFADKLTLFVLIVNGIFFTYSIIKGDFQAVITLAINFAWIFFVRMLECKIDDLTYIVLHLKNLLFITRVLIGSKNFSSLLEGQEKENFENLAATIDEIGICEMPEKEK